MNNSLKHKFLITLFTDTGNPILDIIKVPIEKKESIVMTTHNIKETQTISVTSEDDVINAENTESVVLL